MLTHWPLGNLSDFRNVIFKQLLVIDGWGISYEIALIWMSLDFTDDQSTLVQVMAWCRQATSHYLSQCWPRSLSPYGVTRPQWVNPSGTDIGISWSSKVCIMAAAALAPYVTRSSAAMVLSMLVLIWQGRISTTCTLSVLMSDKNACQASHGGAAVLLHGFPLS